MIFLTRIRKADVSQIQIEPGQTGSHQILSISNGHKTVTFVISGCPVFRFWM